MNNMLKNLVIWLVIGLVLMTVFNQFNTRGTAQALTVDLAEVSYARDIARARTFGFTKEQIRAWEQGRTSPVGGVRAYLMMIDADHDEACGGQMPGQPAKARRRSASTAAWSKSTWARCAISSASATSSSWGWGASSRKTIPNRSR